MRTVLAAFDGEEALRRALEKLREEEPGGDVETYTPKPLDPGVSRSPLPLIIFAAGMLGALSAFALMTYADVWSYPLNIGGRPNFSWPVFVPTAFEVGVLWAVAAGFFGYLALNRLPRLYDPIDDCESIGLASRDGWLLAIRCPDTESIERARRVLSSFHPATIEEVPA